MAKTIINKANGLYTMTLRSERFPTVVVKMRKILSLEDARTSAECFLPYLAELEAAHELNLGRKALSDARTKCEALQNAYPNAYLFDECISIENASDGRTQDGNRKFGNLYECDWTADECREVARHMLNDTAVRAMDLNIDGSNFEVVC